MRKISAIFVVLFMTVALCSVSTAADFTLDFGAWRYTLEEVQSAIRSGANVNAKDDLGHTPLMYAAGYSGDPEIIKALILAGANVNETANPRLPDAEGPPWFEGATPLIWAANSTKNSDVLRVLIQAGADVNLKDDMGWTALMHAAYHNGDLEVLRVLIQGGAEVNAKDNIGRTPLMWGIWGVDEIHGDPDVIRVLTQAGADVSVEDDYGGTALTYAENIGDPDIMNALK